MSDHVLIKAAEARRVLGNMSRPHFLKIEANDPRFPKVVWMHGARFYWLDELHAYIAACAKDGPPPVNRNLRPRRKRAA